MLGTKEIRNAAQTETRSDDRLAARRNNRRPIQKTAYKTGAQEYRKRHCAIHKAVASRSSQMGKQAVNDLVKEIGQQIAFKGDCRNTMAKLAENAGETEAIERQKQKRGLRQNTEASPNGVVAVAVGSAIRGKVSKSANVCCQRSNTPADTDLPKNPVNVRCRREAMRPTPSFQSVRETACMCAVG